MPQEPAPVRHHPYLAKRLCFKLALIALSALAAPAQPSGCNAPAASPSVTIALPSRPFAVRPSADGCQLFVSLMGDNTAKNPGIAMLTRAGGRIELLRVVPLKSPPAGLAPTHDGKLLVATAADGPVFLDVERMASGAANPVLGSFSDGANSQSVYANVSPGDKLLFVSEERAHSITVIDLPRALSNGYKADAIIGKIPVGNAPIALTFSPDGKWLYTTSQGAMADWHWPKACKPEGRDPATAQISNPEGAVVVIDVARASTDPAQAVVARVPAGCSPVRMAITPDGSRVYVTARNSNAVLAFDTAKLLSDPGHARVGEAPVGAAPVPIAVVDAGRKVIAGNSDRFAASTAPQSLVVLDTTKMEAGAGATLGIIAAGAFPREMALSADGHTLFLTNFGSNSLQVIDADRLPLAPNRQQ
jgi:DNA-binding beta-propeller fold protein YncE